MSDGLSYADTVRVLRRLGDSTESIVLIGGQALNFWAEQYADKTWELGAEAPYASKDIDFCGTQADVGACAAALQGRPSYQSNKARSLCTGVVTYVDDNNTERQLDFLTKPYGLEAEDLWTMSIPATIAAEDGKEATLRIMHPLHCLMSRVANVGGLQKYQTPHALSQLRASIVCMRQFLAAQLDENEHDDDEKDVINVVKKLNERVFRFSVKSKYAQSVYSRHAVEPFSAALLDDRLPSKFRTTRYPQMQEALATRRAAGDVGTDLE